MTKKVEENKAPLLEADRRTALKNILLTATCATPVVTSILAPKTAEAQFTLPPSDPLSPIRFLRSFLRDSAIALRLWCI